MERKLATIRRIDDIVPIEGADLIVLAIVGGWQCVVQKDAFNVGDLAVYLEIDSWVPHELAPFLSKGKEPREFNGVKGERLKTIRLRGQLSQGLLLPFEGEGAPLIVRDWSLRQLFQHTVEDQYLDNRGFEGCNVTDVLGVIKWERALAANLVGRARGNFPVFLRKTDEERVQNLTRTLDKYTGQRFEATIKMDGSSMTVYFINNRSPYFSHVKEENVIDDGPEKYAFGVCSRNLDLIETEGNQFWKSARECNLINHIFALAMYLDTSVAIQGELVGSGIQNNYEKMNEGEYKFFLYNIFDINTQKYLAPIERRAACELAKIPHVPHLCDFDLGIDILNNSASLLAFAEGPGMNKGVMREGVVYKHMDSEFSFKAISNSYLEKTGN